MTARHLPIIKGRHTGVPGSINMVKLVNRILRHNHWGWGHVVEICQHPNVHGQPLHHLARKIPSEGTRIARLRLPSPGDLWRGAMNLRRLNGEKVVKGPDHLVIPSRPSRTFPTLAHVGPHAPAPDNKPFTAVYPRPSKKRWARGGTTPFLSKGGGGIRGGRVMGLCKEGGLQL